MTGPRETLWIEVPGPSAGLLRPGLVQYALFRGAGISADEVGLLRPEGRERVAVELAARRAGRLATPRTLVVRTASGPITLRLRRETDPPEEELAELLVSWEDGGPAPRPGSLGVALAGALEAPLGTEELGWGFAGPGWLRVRVPERVLGDPGLPATLSVDARSLHAEAPVGKRTP